jgi:diadenosine tetraphosphate (Ap4A) HIT family hydrolase
MTEECCPVEKDCITCRYNRGELQSPGGVIYKDDLWQLEHVHFPVPALGWLVLKPRRHVEYFADLTPEELAPYGPLAGRISGALREVLNPVKVYMCLFAEAENAAHVHIHFIPRLESTPIEYRGPGVFQLLAQANHGAPSAAEPVRVEQIVNRLRDLIKV